MSKNVTLTLVIKGDAEELRKKYASIIKQAQKAYLVSASGRIVPIDSNGERA